MNSFRKWLYKPKKTDKSLLAQFYHADEELNTVAAELDSFDGRKDPERCAGLVAKLRSCQDKVLGILEKVMVDVLRNKRASRDFRVKFPDDVLQESLAGQLWFGAECLAAGSSIMNRETESCSMRPLARALTKNLDCLRCILRDQCLRSCDEYSDRIKEALVIFDKLFAEFEFSYVSAMVPVKSKKEYECVQEITVLFSETLQRALKLDLLKQDMIDDYDPALMFTIPRLAIVSGLLVFNDGPLCPDADASSMSEIFRPFQSLLFKIRELLLTLNEHELFMLEKVLCSNDESSIMSSYSQTHYKSSEHRSSQCNTTISQSSSGSEMPHSSRQQDIPESSLDEYLDTSVVVHSPKLQHSNSDHFSIGQMSHSSSTVTVIQGQRSFDSGDSQIDQIDGKGKGVEDFDLQSDNLSNPDNAGSLTSCDNRVAELPSTAESSKTDHQEEDIPKEICEDVDCSVFKCITSSASAQTQKLSCKDCASARCKSCSEKLTSKSTPSKFQNEDKSFRNCSASYSNSILNDSSRKWNATKCDNQTRHSSDTTNNISLSLKNKKYKNCQRGRSPSKYVLRKKQSATQTDYQSKVPDYHSDSESSTCSTCISDCEWDNVSQETSSYSSECNDDEEITLAIQAAELASRSEARSRFRSSSDLIHRLFVCISGVADQLQTNYASDLRNILKSVFDINCSDPVICNDTAKEKKERGLGNLELPSHDSYRSRSSSSRSTTHDNADRNRRNARCGRGAPLWVPDELTSHCTSCRVPFTFIKRRHHCRNCGQIYCNRCSGNIVPLPHYGLTDPVRVCNRCYMYHVSPFTVEGQ